MDLGLKGSVIAVTGGGAGIGQGIHVHASPRARAS
jgi:NAD(P)-dependent dehydrogenase (short-subunit alcohol dehydrogenase family)